jgi:hypothetical protein
MKKGFNNRVSFGTNLGLSAADTAVLARLSSPEKIQDFVSALDINRETDGDTCLSVTETLKAGHAHCIEGAFVAACGLWLGGSPPLLMDMQASGDDDHVVALFRSHGCWGAISKSNHVWVRWRDPVYATFRELAMSYFHEYVKEDRKTLRTYSASFDLRRFSPGQWVTAQGSCWEIAGALDNARHYKLLTPRQQRALRPRDTLEMRAGRIVEYPAKVRALKTLKDKAK